MEAAAGLGRALVTPGAPRPPPGVPAQVGNKINPKVSMGAARRGDQKGKGPGGEKGVFVPPLLGEKLARAISPPPPPSLLSVLLTLPF